MQIRLGLVSDLQRLDLGLVSNPERLVSVSSRTKCPTSRSRLGSGLMRLGSRLGLGLKGLVHIPGSWLKA